MYNEKYIMQTVEKKREPETSGPLKCILLLWTTIIWYNSCVLYCSFGQNKIFSTFSRKVCIE